MLAEADLPLPPLREDLRLSEPARSANGEPTWVIQDSVLNRFYRIGWLEFECLLRWGQTAAQVCEQIAAQTALKPDVDQVMAFRRFLENNQLVRPSPGMLAHLRQREQGNAWFTWRWWLHHYLFFRIPLLRPQRMLVHLTRWLDWVFRPLTAAVIIGLSLLGIVLALHQWDTFRTAVVESFSTEGLLSFALALAVAKTLHELAHAVVATRLGLRVAHMGVAFLVMWPMLYTDTGESWKLHSARQRLAIASAGILCELSLAGLATLGWALSDPGALRNALLYLATTSWVLSLGLNASPFMRFDGYFILSDLVDIPNLHERAAAQARVAIRRGLLGLDEPWPEPFSPSARRLLVGFALVTWLYRLVVFLGIAVTVYLFFFKVLGIFLFLVEVTWFIMLPISRELRYWWKHRAGVRGPRRWLFGAALCGVLLLLAVPWRTSVHAFGVARAEHLLRVFSPFPARIQSIHGIGNVAPGDTLAVLDEPDIGSRLQGSEAGRAGYQARLAGLIADNGGLDVEAATRQRLGVQSEEAQSARLEMARLNLKAPFAGQWRDVDPGWLAGQWMGTRELIGVLVDPSRWQVDAYVRQDAVQRLQVGNAVRFYPDGQTAPIRGTVVAIASTRAKQLAHAMLASRYKGPLTVAAERDALIPNPPVFHVLVQLEAPPPVLHEVRGQLQIEGNRCSLLGEAVTHLAAVLRRESGF